VVTGKDEDSVSIDNEAHLATNGNLGGQVTVKVNEISSQINLISINVMICNIESVFIEESHLAFGLQIEQDLSLQISL